MIFHHTGDSKFVDLLWFGEWHLPGPWLIPGTNIDVSPTKHVVFMILAAFLTIEISGLRALGPTGYLKTIVMVPPGMKGAGAVIMAIIMTPVELIGKLVKPFALTLRLFANMTAGHFVILVLLGLIFVFGTAPAVIRYGVVTGSIALTLFMMFLELLVAFLQAYIFA